MSKILVMGGEDYFTHHLLFWLKANKIEFDYVPGSVFSYEEEYESVIFCKHVILDTYDTNNMADFFNIHLSQLNNILLHANSSHLIYVDFTNGILQKTNNDLNNKLKQMSLQMIKSYSSNVRKHYDILYIYDLIGYKNFEFFGLYNNLNDQLESQKNFIWSYPYSHLHLVYIFDVMNMLLKLIDKSEKKIINNEYHVRYDNKGTDIKDIVFSFEKYAMNIPKFKYIEIYENESTAPF